MTAGYLPLAEHLPVKPESLWRIAVAFNKLLIGRLNVIKGVTLAANAASTTILDPRLSGQTALYFGPTTVNAAICAPTLWYDGKGKGTVTVHHLNNASVDRSYDILIIG